MTATILIMPLAKRAGRVRDVAGEYSAREGRSASSYWRQVTAAQGAALKRLGLPDAEIRRELEGFRGAVQAHLQRPEECSDAGDAA